MHSQMIQDDPPEEAPKVEPEPPKVLTKDNKWRKVHVPAYWRPEPGQSVSGTYVDRRWKQGPNGEYEVLILNTSTGLVTIAGCVLMTLLDAIAPITKDTQLQVTYNGTLMSSGGNPVKDFELFVKVK